MMGRVVCNIMVILHLDGAIMLRIGWDGVVRDVGPVVDLRVCYRL
jgi:hypothetical protein